MEQLSLDLAFPPRFGETDYVVAPSNAAAHAVIGRWPDWPGQIVLLVGPAGSGKSHLASTWRARAGARRLDGSDLATFDPRDAGSTNVLVEDADAVSSGEANLFHLLNLLRESKQSGLLTAKTPPNLWGLATADLLSRLRQAPLVRLEAPDDALVRAVLVKLFTDRQLRVDSTVVDFIALRIERSIAAARQLVALLDRTSLAEGRRITRPIAAQVLAILDS